MTNIKKSINWGPVIFLVTYQVALLVTLPFYLYSTTPSLGISITAFVLFFLTGLSITAGYHRYYAHRSFKTNSIVEFILLFFATLSSQGSALRWAFDHRRHHAHVDTDEDPYSINKGFWYAHCLWIIEEPKPIDKRIVSDLVVNPQVMFQDKYYRTLLILSNFVVFLFFGALFNDYLGSFFIVTLLRMFALHHCTWFINSLAHTWGDKPFSVEHSAVNNYIISLLTFGEGYHNYHHTFANDYRNGVRWYQFDPTKWLIWTLNKLGLTHSLKRVDSLTIKRKMITEHKALLMEKLETSWAAGKEELEKTVHDLADCLVKKLNEFNHLKAEYQKLCRDKVSFELIYDTKDQIRELKKTLREDWRRWSQLSQQILTLESATPA